MVNNCIFDEEDYLDSKNFHYFLSMYTGSLTLIVIHNVVRDLRVTFIC